MYPTEDAEFSYFVRVKDESLKCKFKSVKEICDVVPGETGLITDYMKESEIKALNLGVSAIKVLD